MPLYTKKRNGAIWRKSLMKINWVSLMENEKAQFE